MAFRHITAAVSLLFAAFQLAAQTDEVDYRDASLFPIFGKCVENTSGRYERLPAEYENVSRPAVWNLGRNSAGLYIRFRSDSPAIYARWKSGGTHMPHMTDVGDNGLDLYILTEKDGWRFAGSGFEWNGGHVKSRRLVGNMVPEMREYMLYLSLYDRVESLEIGIDPGYVLQGPEAGTPRTEKKIVMYGSSILQGGCASRPGMAFTSIIGRKLNREVINLGFSGNALLDLEIAQLMARVENPGVFVLDYVPNASAEKITSSGETFFRVLRDAHPDVPVLFVEDPTFPHAAFDQKILQEINAKNAAQRALFERLKKAGEKKIFYLPTEKLIGSDGEATVDGIHFTDLGMMRYSDAIIPLLRKALK
ncbi:MAG: hydrolase [Bacteroidales bacterium]|jgi:lysophospholipase L1-like esterase|nr:SGNH/GDSL hydrolase family protein [Bacteroidota bacterium]NLO00316.1 hydrolase [Bacteroidales bacterium]